MVFSNSLPNHNMASINSDGRPANTTRSWAKVASIDTTWELDAPV
jgi:hypothetical protein